MGTVLPLLASSYMMSGEGSCGDQVATSGLPIRPIPRRKIHCLLPSSPWLADSKTNIQLGLLYIAAVLREAGHDVLVTSMLDKRVEGQIALPAAALACDLHLVGFCTPQFGEALEVAAYLKDRCPGTTVVAGGAHPSYEPKEVKEATRQPFYHVQGPLRARRRYAWPGEPPLFDSVVVMEGEVAILQLLTDWDAGRLQPYYYGDKSQVPDLDQIPFPAWDLLPLDHLHNDGRAVMKTAYFPNAQYPSASPGVMSLIGTRGCPYKCTYCSTPWIGQKPRYRSPENLIAEMARVMATGVRQFKFQDDTYTLHRTKLRELSSAIHAAFGPDSFACRVHTRVNTMDAEIAESLRRMNCRVCCFGVESGSQAVLDANWKGTTVAQNTRALQVAHDAGFRTIAFLVMGMAGETLDTMRETQDWLRSVQPHLDDAVLAMGVPYPGSRWWTHPADSGVEILDYNYDNQWLTGFSAREEVLVRPYGCTVDDLFRIKHEMFDFMCAHGWKKREWDFDAAKVESGGAEVCA